MLAHVPDINDFVAGFAHGAEAGGRAHVRVPAPAEPDREVQFDTIYHEHFSYLSLLAVEQVLAAHGLGSSMSRNCRPMAARCALFWLPPGVAHAGRPSAARRARRGAAAGLDRLEGYDGFAGACRAVRAGFLGSSSRRAKAAGRPSPPMARRPRATPSSTIAASTRDDIVCVFDRNPAKQGRCCPAATCRFFAGATWPSTRPDYVLILPWNLEGRDRSASCRICDWGGRLSSPSPS